MSNDDKRTFSTWRRAERVNDVALMKWHWNLSIQNATRLACLAAAKLSKSMLLNITLNGSPHALLADTSIETLLAELGYAQKRVAIERNGAIVPRSAHSSTHIEAHDQLEIVQAIGGG